MRRTEMTSLNFEKRSIGTAQTKAGHSCASGPVLGGTRFNFCCSRAHTKVLDKRRLGAYEQCDFVGISAASCDQEPGLRTKNGGALSEVRIRT
jgi:hypothetical protein